MPESENYITKVCKTFRENESVKRSPLENELMDLLRLSRLVRDFGDADPRDLQNRLIANIDSFRHDPERIKDFPDLMSHLNTMESWAEIHKGKHGGISPVETSVLVEKFKELIRKLKGEGKIKSKSAGWITKSKKTNILAKLKFHEKLAYHMDPVDFRAIRILARLGGVLDMNIGAEIEPREVFRLANSYQGTKFEGLESVPNYLIFKRRLEMASKFLEQNRVPEMYNEKGVYSLLAIKLLISKLDNLRSEKKI